MDSVPAERVLVYERIDGNRRLTFVLLAGFIVLMAAFFAAIGVFLTLYAGVPEGDQVRLSVQIAVAGAIVSLAFGLLMYYTAPATVLMISGVHEVGKEDEPQLYNTVENLCIGSGRPLPKLYGGEG